MRIPVTLEYERLDKTFFRHEGIDDSFGLKATSECLEYKGERDLPELLHLRQNSRHLLHQEETDRSRWTQVVERGGVMPEALS